MFHVKHFGDDLALHEHNSSSVLPVRVSPSAAVCPIQRQSSANPTRFSGQGAHEQSSRSFLRLFRRTEPAQGHGASEHSGQSRSIVFPTENEMALKKIEYLYEIKIPPLRGTQNTNRYY